jgi:hypothetical protein
MDQRTKEKYSKLFFVGALWNMSIASSALLLPKLSNKLTFGFKSVIKYGPTTFALKLTWALVFIYGIGYYLVSKEPEKNRGIVWMGIIGKLAFFFTALAYYQKKIITLLTTLLCFGDFIFSILFALFLVKTKDEARQTIQTATS